MALNIWVLERSDKENMQRVCAQIAEQVRRGGERVDIHWRIVPPSNLWPECIRLMKSEPHTIPNYPDIIEYPAYLEPSLRYLKLFKEKGTPWLIGYPALYYRRDVLERIHKSSSDLDTYPNWLLTLESASGQFPQGTLDVQADFMSAMWWIWTFGGDFLDPLNYATSFANAESLRGLEGMIRALTGPARRTGANFWDSSSHWRSYFPDSAFMSLSHSIPASILDNDHRVGCVSAPRMGKQRILSVQEYRFGITVRGASEKGTQPAEFLSAFLGSSDLWVDIGRLWGYLPADKVLQERFWEGVEDTQTRAVFETAHIFAKTLPATPLIAPLIKIFEDTLESVLVAAMRDKSVDIMRLATAFSKASSEYRLIAALYGPLEIPDEGEAPQEASVMEE